MIFFFCNFYFFINFYWSKKGNISYKIESAERAPRERRESAARAPHRPECTTQIFLESLATVMKRLNRLYYIESAVREAKERRESAVRAPRERCNNVLRGPRNEE